MQRPYTFIVLAILILIGGALAAARDAHRHLPRHSRAVIGVAFQYTGLSPDDMSGRIITPYDGCSPPPSTTSSTSKASPCRGSAS
ncbi:MAG: hypothetical protein WDM92_00135 [Caulobacteraceae bacterium]